MNRPRSWWLVGGLALILGPGLSAAEDPADVSWSRFRGAGSQGVADDGAAYPASLDLEGGLAWRVEVPRGHSSPCILGDRIFLTGATDDALVTLCLARTDGRLLWRRAVPLDARERVHEINSLASPTPACDGARVYVEFGSFGLLCYDLDGEEVWRRERPVAKNMFGTAASLTLVGERLIVVNDQKEDPSLELIDGPTGETIWKRDRSAFGSGWSTPVARRVGDVEEVIVYGVWWLTAYDLADGTERWAVPGLADEPCITPALADGLVFVTSYNMKTNPEVIGLPEFSTLLEAHDADGDGALSKEEADENESVLSRHDADGEGDHPLRIFFRFLDEDRDGRITATEWTKIVDWVDGFKQKNAVIAVRPGAGPSGDVEIAWQHHRGIPECPSPLAHGGRLYLVKNGGLVSCFDAATGAVHYQARLDAGGPYYASPVAADGKVYFASARGEVSVIEEGDELNILSRSELGARIMATPALVAGAVYIRTESELLAFNSKM